MLCTCLLLQVPLGLDAALAYLSLGEIAEVTIPKALLQTVAGPDGKTLAGSMSPVPHQTLS